MGSESSTACGTVCRATEPGAPREAFVHDVWISWMTRTGVGSAAGVTRRAPRCSTAALFTAFTVPPPAGSAHILWASPTGSITARLMRSAWWERTLTVYLVWRGWISPACGPVSSGAKRGRLQDHTC